MPSDLRRRSSSRKLAFHTHATQVLARGAGLTTVRDNLRHASITTTSICLHGDEVILAQAADDAIHAARVPGQHECS